MKTRMMAVPILVACLMPGLALATTFGWTGGKLSDFLAENAINGLSFPLQPPNELFINPAGRATVDLSLGNESTVNAARGQIAIEEGHAISNAATGVFNVGNVSQIIALGDAELSVFQNEGVVRKSGDVTTTISARFGNYNGGTVEAGAGAVLRLANAEIRHQSLFSGLGYVHVSGLLSGEIHSDQSLVIMDSGPSTGDDVAISGAWRWSGPIVGTWTNLGHVRGSTVNEGWLGTMRGGTRFINDGTVSGVFMEMDANTDSLAVADRTTFVNNGVLEFDSPENPLLDLPTKIRTSGNRALHVVNNGVLKIIDSHDKRERVHLGAVLFENRGTIDVVAGSTFTIGFGLGAAPNSGSGPTNAVFLNGTQFTGAGVTNVTGSSAAQHDFSGVIFSENLRLGGGTNRPTFNGIGATLLGTAEWRSGTMTGAWFSGATLNLGSPDSAPTLAGTLTNTGIIQQAHRFHLMPNATLVNFGLYALTGGASNDIVGDADSIVDTVSNLGQFHTQSSASASNTIRDVRFVNHGLMQITSRTILFNTVLENFGIINGTGELRITAGSTFLNEGTIAPGLSPGTLRILGDFTNGPNGVVEIEMASATVFDVLNVSGDVNLGGTLRIKLLDGFVPDLDTAFTFLRYGELIGAFDDIVLEGFADAKFNVAYGGSSFGLAFTSIPAPVPLPPAAWLLGSALSCLAWKRRAPPAGRVSAA